MRHRVFFAAFSVLLITSACSRASEITAPAAPVHPAHTDVTGDSANRGPGLAGSGN